MSGSIRDFLQWAGGGDAFSQKETALFLEKVAVDRLPAATIVKLERLDLLGFLEVLSRNLEALLNKRSEA